tara:strand:- start:73 stop:936 length:864 start_codon:yes stop_codon:yes gene_type:complete
MNKKQENKIVLGTAQFSNNYGITNNKFLSNNEIKNILEDALKFSIKTIDTAPNYEGVEKKIGKFNLKSFNLITKVSLIKNNSFISLNDLKHNIRNSLSNLNIDKIYAVLLRNPKELLRNKKLLDVLKEYKKKEKISKIGYTLYDVKELEELYKYFKPDIVQIPFSIVDKSFEKKNWISKMYYDGVEIHVRSIFLQGLLLENVSNLPKKFLRYKGFFEKFNLWVHKKKLSKLQACLGPILADKRITKVVIGINSRKNLAQLNNIKENNIIYPEWFKLKDKNLLNPSNW